MISLFSPAKINRFLEVVGKRPDGYHEILTKMQTISLFDELRMEIGSQTELVCTDPTIPSDEGNLVLQAHRIFEKKLGRNCPVRYFLDKKIPSQAGLGGGSSNGATTLWGLNELFGNPFSLEQLKDMGAAAGSDVPFFFSSGLAICSGRGERVLDLPLEASEKVTLVKSGVNLSTKQVYQAFSPSSCANQLEPAAFAVAPELAQLKQTLLDSGFSEVALTGSGSAFFCLGKGSVAPGLWSVEAATVVREPEIWYE